MFRYFEHLIDPYQAYDESAEIPDRLIPFLRRFLWPARWVIGIGMTIGLISALAEAAVVKFAAELVDMLSSTTPDRLWQDHGWALALMAVVALLIRPAADVAWTLVTGQGFYPHMGALSAGGRTARCCASRSASSPTTSPAGSPTSRSSWRRR